MHAGRIVAAVQIALLAACAPLPAQEPAQGDLGFGAAVAAVRRVQRNGPAQVLLADRSVLVLQQGVAWIPAAEGLRLLRAIGVRVEATIAGVAVFTGDGAVSFAVLYERAGGAPGIPEIGAQGWTLAPELAVLQPR